MRLSKHAAARPYTMVMAKTAMPSLGDMATKVMGPNDMKPLGEMAWKGLQVASVGLPLITATAAAASAVYDKMTAASRKAQAFKTMVTENPHLQDRDPVLVQRYFNTLHNLNPQLAHDPTVAASFVNNMAVTNSDPRMPHRDILAQALQIQRGGPHGGGGGALDAMKGVGEALQGVHKIVSDQRTDKLQKQLGTMSEEHKNKIQEMAERMRGVEQDSKVQQRWRSMAKNRAKSLQSQLGESQRDREYFESLLQQHGIQY